MAAHIFRQDINKGHGKLENEADSMGDSGFGGSFPLNQEEERECDSFPLNQEEELECDLKDLNIKDDTDLGHSEVSTEYIARGECQRQFRQSNNATTHSPPTLGTDVQLLKQVFSQDEDGDTFAHLAVSQMKEDMVHRMINLASQTSRKLLDVQNKLGQTILQLATYVNLTSIIRKLIDIGVDVELPDNKGQTIVHIAAERDNYDALKSMYTISPYFTQEVIDAFNRLLEAKNYKGLTPLQWAVKHKSFKVAQLLVQIGANINAQDSMNGYTALHHAVLSGDISFVAFLISTCNPDLNAISYTGVTPLILALGSGREQISALLIATGADTDRETWEGDSWETLSSSQ